jgi:sulfide:quinone oxidoreductase
MGGRLGPRIVVVGGGFAGLEAAFTLRERLGPRSRITIVSDETVFTFRPDTVYVPFGGDPVALTFSIVEPTRRQQIPLIASRVQDIDPASRQLNLHGEEMEYDVAVLATGASMRLRDVPGLAEHGILLWKPNTTLPLRWALRDLRRDVLRGREMTVALLVPPGNLWSGPLYELTLMLETWLRRQKIRDRVRIELVTHEPAFADALGPRMHAEIERAFTRRGIGARTGARVVEVHERVLRHADGRTTEFDLLIALPPYESSARFESLPVDGRGFVRVERDTGRVAGLDDVYVIGDAADFPVKQAHLAIGQADAAAEAIVAGMEARAPRFGFRPTAMFVLEQLDRATYAEVPLATDAEGGLAVAADTSTYRVTTSPLWRVGKRALFHQVMRRFQAGLPIHDGVRWMGLDVTRRLMVGAIAD